MSKKQVVEEILKFAKEKISQEEDKGPIKTVAMKPEWIKLHNEVIAIKKEANLLMNKAESIGDEKWAMIRRELNYPPYDLQISEDGSEVRMFEDED